MQDKLVTYCQIAFKSRQVSMGDRLIPSIQTKNAKLVCVSNICGKNRRKKLFDKCAFYQVPCIEIDSERFDKISNASINSFAVCDEGLAKEIIKEMKG